MLSDETYMGNLRALSRETLMQCSMQWALNMFDDLKKARKDAGKSFVPKAYWNVPVQQIM